MKISLPAASVMQKPDFVYGVATSSFQIEGAAELRDPSIWDTFCATPGKIKDASDGLIACDHYHLWEQDIDLIASLGVDAYRFSICWPRIIRKDGIINQEGLDFYIAILDRLNEKGIKPFVTLYHWDLPQHLEDEGGWLNRDTAYQFRDYVDVVTKAFGQRVYSYATLNEPFCSAYLGYEAGVHAPGHANVNYGRKAAHHLLLAHGLGMQVLQQNAPHALNGIVLNFTPAYPASDSPADVQATKDADEYHNQWYIQPIMEGRYPDVIEKLPEAQKPDVEPGDMAIISQSLDFMGINFYTRTIYRAPEEQDPEPFFVEIPPSGVPTTEMGWEIYPDALVKLLTSLNQRYSLPPLYITENGAAMDDKLVDGEVNDLDRLEYYQQHLSAVDTAIQQGVDVRGYFAWSLMDNFEWAEGYVKRFGIVYVDYQTQQRTPKASALAYAEMITSRS